MEKLVINCQRYTQILQGMAVGKRAKIHTFRWQARNICRHLRHAKVRLIPNEDSFHAGLH